MYRALRIFGAYLAIVALILAAGCNGPRYQREAGSQSSAATASPTAVRVVCPKPANTDALSAPLPGIVKSKHQVAVAFQVSGCVATVAVELGQPVKRGAILASLDKTLFLAQRDQAAAALAQARAQLDLANAGARPEEILALQAQVDSAQAVADKAQADYARAQQLFAEGVIPKQSLDAAHTGLVQAQKALEAATQQLKIAQHGARDEEKHLAQAGVQAAQAALGQVEAQLGYADLQAPFDGAITMREVEAGQVISAGLPVLELADLSTLDILTQLPEARFGEIKLDQAATISFPALPQLSIPASVVEAAPKADQATRAFALKLRLANPPREVLPGMVALVQLQPTNAVSGLCIPRRCLLDDGVFVVIDGKAVKRAIQVLADQGDQVIVSGLSSGDQVVLNGQEYIKNGEPVRVVDGLGMERLVELGEQGQ